VVLDSVEEIVSFEGLCDKVRGSHAQTFVLFGGIMHATEQDDGDVFARLFGFEVAENLKTIHAWHMNVENNEIRGLCQGGSQ